MKVTENSKATGDAPIDAASPNINATPVAGSGAAAQLLAPYRPAFHSQHATSYTSDEIMRKPRIVPQNVFNNSCMARATVMTNAMP
jgi:hypothetical protein